VGELVEVEDILIAPAMRHMEKKVGHELRLTIAPCETSSRAHNWWGWSPSPFSIPADLVARRRSQQPWSDNGTASESPRVSRRLG
jgi:hypothetical protein